MMHHDALCGFDGLQLHYAVKLKNRSGDRRRQARCISLSWCTVITASIKNMIKRVNCEYITYR